VSTAHAAELAEEREREREQEQRQAAAAAEAAAEAAAPRRCGVTVPRCNSRSIGYGRIAVSAVTTTDLFDLPRQLGVFNYALVILRRYTLL